LRWLLIKKFGFELVYKTTPTTMDITARLFITFTAFHYFKRA
jgi:hypothetical protein